MMLDEIEILRSKLNQMVTADDAILFAGEILKLSQKLDKLIFVKQSIMLERTRSNYSRQLQSLLCPALYVKIAACY